MYPNMSGDPTPRKADTTEIETDKYHQMVRFQTNDMCQVHEQTDLRGHDLWQDFINAFIPCCDKDLVTWTAFMEDRGFGMEKHRKKRNSQTIIDVLHWKFLRQTTGGGHQKCDATQGGRPPRPQHGAPDCTTNRDEHRLIRE